MIRYPDESSFLSALIKLIDINYYPETVEVYDKNSKGAKDGYFYLEDPKLVLETINYKKIFELYDKDEPFIIRMKKIDSEDSIVLAFNSCLKKYGLMYMAWYYNSQGKLTKITRVDINGKTKEEVNIKANI